MRSKASCLQKSVIAFEIIHTISSVLGLSPCRIKISRRSAPAIGFTFVFSNSRLKCGYSLLLMILYIGITAVGTPCLNELLYPNDSSTMRIITVVLSGIGNSIVIVMILFYLILRRNIIRIGDQLHDFDERFARLSGRSADILDFLPTFITIALMLIIWTGLVIMQMITQNGIIYLTTCGLNEVFCGWLLVQYSVVINVLKDRFRGLNAALLDTAICPNILEAGAISPRCTSTERLAIDNLMMIRQARNRIYKVFQEVSRYYSFPVLIVIAYCCSCCVCDMYFCILSLIRPTTSASDKGQIFLDSIFWTLSASYPIVVLSASVNRFQAEADRTAVVVYDIMEMYAPNREIESELNTLAIELLHKKIYFNTCGFISLDCTLLRSIFGTVMTYLLIVLQFKAPDNSPNK
nr:PREDICTED: putative gustatory receptor 2a [Fopius arisanus]